MPLVTQNTTFSKIKNIFKATQNNNSGASNGIPPGTLVTLGAAGNVSIVSGSLINYTLSGSPAWSCAISGLSSTGFSIYDHQPKDHFQFLPEWLKTAYSHDTPVHIIIENCLKSGKTRDEIVEEVCAYLFKIHRLKAEIKNELPI